MIIIGPLTMGVRLLFTISFTVPDQYTTAMGDAILTDSLPTGLSLYTETDSRNSVTINGVKVTDGITFTKSTVSTCIISAAKLTKSVPVVVTFDTIISSLGLARDKDIENKSSLTFSASSKFVSTGGSVKFQITGKDDIYYLSPDHAPFSTDTDIILKLEFTAAANTGEYNYHVSSDFGSNITFDKTASDALNITYENGETITPVQGITITDPTIAGSNLYVFNFPNAAGLESKVVTVVIKAKTNYPSTAPENITYKFDVTIGGAVEELKTQLIPVSIEVPLTKDIMDI